MNAHEVARRFEKRPGYDLIDYAEIALPLYRLTIEAITMAHQELPPIKEFVLRTANAGLINSSDISSFLGIDLSTVSATISQLGDDRYVAIDENDEKVEILDRGRKIIAKGSELYPQDETIQFLYDRLLRKPIWIGGHSLLTPSQIDPQRTIEIRAYPADGPEVDEFRLQDVSTVLRKQIGGDAAFSKDLLKLKRITRRARLYRQGIGLVYKKQQSAEIQIAFIVDDARHEGLEHAFAAAGGPKKMGFIQSIDEFATNRALRRHLGNEVNNLLPEQRAFDEKRTKLSTARLKHQIAIGKSLRMNSKDQVAEKISENIALAERDLKQAEADLKGFPACPIASYEIPELLSTAIDGFESFLAISSTQLQKHLVDAKFLTQIEKKLKSGKARVLITLSNELSLTKTSAKGFDPNIELEKLAQKYDNLDVKFDLRREFHHLILDDKFAAITNRPMLSNIGKVRSFHHFVGNLLQSPDLVSVYTNRILGSMPPREN